MYTIAVVAYGLPIKIGYHAEHVVSSTADEELSSSEKALRQILDYCGNSTNGFHGYYNGGGDEEPRMFGIEVSKFDECSFSTDIDSLTLRSTEEQRAEWRRNFDALPENVKDFLKELGEPRDFILWTTS